MCLAKWSSDFSLVVHSRFMIIFIEIYRKLAMETNTNSGMGGLLSSETCWNRGTDARTGITLHGNHFMEVSPVVTHLVRFSPVVTSL